MFTSIKLLRDSSASQERVSQVERSLKKQNARWESHWLFPIAAIGLSNSVDDVHWVNGSDLIRDTSERQVIVETNRGPAKYTYKTLVASLNTGKNVDDMHSIGKMNFIGAYLTAFNERLAELTGNTLDSYWWNSPIVFANEDHLSEVKPKSSPRPVDLSAKPVPASTKTVSVVGKETNKVFAKKWISPRVKIVAESLLELNDAEREEFAETFYAFSAAASADAAWPTAATNENAPVVGH